MVRRKIQRKKPTTFATINQVPPLIREMKTPGHQVSRNSKIYNLNPFLDENGILRMSSRIEATPTITDVKLKQTIILHQDHQITKLLIDVVHRKFHHVNKKCVVNHIRQNLWVPKIRVQVNKVVRSCNFWKKSFGKTDDTTYGSITGCTIVCISTTILMHWYRLLWSD